MVAAAKRSDGKIGSQFFITLDDLPQLNNEYWIFGRVKENTETIDLINTYGSIDGKPTAEVVIKRCGVFVPKTIQQSTAVNLKGFKPEIEKRRD